MATTEYRQSAKLFLQSSELGCPNPHPQASVPPSMGSGGGGHTRLRERGGRVPIPTKGLWYSVYISTLWGQLCTSASIPGELWQRFAPDRLAGEQKQRPLRVGSHQAVRHTLRGGKSCAPDQITKSNQTLNVVFTSV